MVAFERLVEAVELAQEEETLWWQQFNSLAEARKVLAAAKKYNADEWEVVQLAEIMEQDLPINEVEKLDVLSLCFAELRAQLKEK